MRGIRQQVVMDRSLNIGKGHMEKGFTNFHAKGKRGGGLKQD